MELKVLSVNVGRSKVIGERDGKKVRSAIAKFPVEMDAIAVGALGLAGDAQVNRRVHGGPDKAVYAYSADHWPWWEGEKNFPCRPGAFGENLTLRGADETQVHIGDRFSWGQAILEVSQPRSPCANFQLYSGRPDAPALMTLSGRSGWYLRVIREGLAPARDCVMRRLSESGGPSVRETFSAMHDRRTGAAERKRIGQTPALSESWKEKFG